jgi:hypothetical protein
MFHMLAAPVMSQATVEVPGGEEVVLQFANLWLRGMRPEVTTRGN